MQDLPACVPEVNGKTGHQKSLISKIAGQPKILQVYFQLPLLLPKPVRLDCFY